MLLDKGFCEPFSVWHEKDDTYHCLNGHQRLTTLKRMRDEGIEIPDLPVNWVLCTDRKDAKQKLLALASQYGEVQGQGLFEFMQDIDMSVEAINQNYHFPEIDISKFEAFFYPTGSSNIYPGEMQWAIEIDEKNDYIVLLFDSKDDFKTACYKLNIKSELRNISASGNETFIRPGIGRVIPGKNLIEKL